MRTNPYLSLEAVIFDMDGVLVDTEPIHYATACALVSPANFPLDDYERFIGTKDLASWLQETYDIPDDIFRKRSSDLFLAELETNGIEPMPGIVDLIDTILANGLAIAVVTMTQPDWTEATLRTAGLQDHFDVIITRNDVAQGKPAPDIYLHAAERLGAKVECSIAIEDSIPGIQSASAAGMQVVQLRQATYVPEPQPLANAVLDTIDAFDHRWLNHGIT